MISHLFLINFWISQYRSEKVIKIGISQVLMSACARTARPDASVCVHTLMFSHPLVYIRSRASISAFSAHATLFDSARCPGRPADLDAARKAIAQDGKTGRERGARGHRIGQECIRKRIRIGVLSVN